MLPFLLISPWLEPLSRALRVPLLLLIGAFCIALPTATLPDAPSGWLSLLVAEFFLGTLIAITFALPFSAFRWLGDMTEALRGAPRSQLPGGQADSTLSFFFHLATLALFASIGGFVHIIHALHGFSTKYPLAQPWPVEMAPLDGTLHLLGDAFYLMVRVGAPIFATALLLEVVLALIARTAPQIPVFFLALPARSLAVLSVAAIGFGTTMMYFAHEIDLALRVW